MLKFILGDPIKKFKKVHSHLMTKAVDAQRNGNMALYAKLSSEADKIYKEILELEEKKK